jgi:Peptidase family M23
MTKLFACLILTFGLIMADLTHAQRVSPANLRVYREAASAGAVNFFVENKLRRDFHIVVRLEMLRGYVCNCQLPFNRNISQGRTLLFTLRPREAVGSQGYQFSWSYWNEVATKKVKDVDYLLPIAEKESLKVHELSGIDPNEEDGRYVIGFTIKKDAKIYAIRKGRVIEIVNDDVSSEKNKIVIRHEDGSKSEYLFLRKDGFIVDELDYVDAGDPIATAGRKEISEGVQLQIRTSYLLWDQYQREGNAYSRHYIKMKFATMEGNAAILVPKQSYTSNHSVDLITQEMTRKEIKNKFKKKKKK